MKTVGLLQKTLKYDLLPAVYLSLRAYKKRVKNIFKDRDQLEIPLPNYIQFIQPSENTR